MRVLAQRRLMQPYDGEAPSQADGAPRKVSVAGQASAARLARHRMLMGLSGCPPAATSGAAEEEPRNHHAHSNSHVKSGEAKSLTDEPSSVARTAGNKGLAASTGAKEAPRKSLTTSAPPFVLNPTVSDFTPSAALACGHASRGKVGTAEGVGKREKKENGGRGGRRGRGEEAQREAESSTVGSGPENLCSVQNSGGRAKATASGEPKRFVPATPTGTCGDSAADPVVQEEVGVSSSMGTGRRPKGGRVGGVGDGEGRDAAGVEKIQAPAGEGKKKRRNKEKAGSASAAAFEDSHTAQAKGSAARTGVDDGKSKKKKGGAWWRSLQDDDPISLEPLNRLRYPPFDLKANDEVTVWFDPRMLGNYLVSSASFVHPVSRRDLTKEDCLALDAHLAASRLRRIGVTDVFLHKERLNDPEERIAVLREEASAIIEAFFSGSSRRQGGGGARGTDVGGQGRGGGRGCVNRVRDGRNGSGDREMGVGMVRGSGRGRLSGGGEGREQGGQRRGVPRGLRDDEEYDNWGFVIDDDEQLALATQRGLAALQEEAFPELCASTSDAPGPDWRPKLASAAAGSRGGGTGSKSVSTEGMGTVFHVSWAHVAQPKKIQSKDLAHLLFPYDCAIKWLDPISALLLVRPQNQQDVSEDLALARVDKNNVKDLAVVRSSDLAAALQSAPSHQALQDYRGKTIARMRLPSAGEFRFLVAQLHHVALASVDGI
jgi:hypothetical protein